MKGRIFLFLAVTVLLATACKGKSEKPLEPADLRGLTKEQLQEMRQSIYNSHGEGEDLTAGETARVEQLRDQERRLDNAWIFGEWRERHGRRLIFRDDGTVSVGARDGAYDELGIYKYFQAEEPSYETVWTLVYDAAGHPVVIVPQPAGDDLLYPFTGSRSSVYERTGDLQTSVETGCFFTKIQ
jgi:hypothetical protein